MSGRPEPFDNAAFEKAWGEYAHKQLQLGIDPGLIQEHIAASAKRAAVSFYLRGRADARRSADESFEEWWARFETEWKLWGDNAEFKAWARSTWPSR